MVNKLRFDVDNKIMYRIRRRGLKVTRHGVPSDVKWHIIDICGGVLLLDCEKYGSIEIFLRCK
jgi:hypothetical protein